MRALIPKIWGVTLFVTVGCSCSQQGDYSSTNVDEAAARPGPPAGFALVKDDGHPLLIEADLVEYDWPSHTMRVPRALFERLAEQASVSGTPFTVMVDGIAYYRGAMTSVFSSTAQRTVAIVFWRENDLPEQATSEIALELGYPAPAFFEGDDPRSDLRVRAALSRAGKLRE